METTEIDRLEEENGSSFKHHADFILKRGKNELAS
jgi:hypothetical protein